MNLAPYKKLYGYGDSGGHRHHCSIRTHTDVFERDPFKIHSYNFHYAERPDGVPIRNIPSRNNNRNEKRFETYYYNPGFGKDRNDKENYTCNRYHESRRRKFLHDSNASYRFCPITHRNCNTTMNHMKYSQSQRYLESNYPSYPTKFFDSHNYLQARPTNSPFLKSVCNRVGSLPPNGPNGNSRTSLNLSARGSSNSLVAVAGSRCFNHETRRSGSSSNLIERGSNLNERRINLNTRRSTSQCSKRSQSHSVQRSSSHNSLTIHRLAPKGKNGSFCQININIKGLEEQQADGNVTIEIETDLDASSSNRNIVISNANTTTNNNGTQHCIQRSNSSRNLNLKNSTSFVIDKRLSKFALKEQINPLKEPLICAERRERDSNPKEKVDVARRSSKDRLPALVAWQPNNLRNCFKDERKDNVGQISHMRRLGEKFNNTYNEVRMNEQKPKNEPSQDNLQTLFKLNNENRNRNDLLSRVLSNHSMRARQRKNNTNFFRDCSPCSLNKFKLPRL